MMSPTETDEFLQRQDPAMLGVIGTLAKDGSPHLVPVWYRWDGEAVLIWTTLDRAWVRHLQRDPRVSISVQESEPPFGAVLIKGRARIDTDVPGHWDEVRRICARYIPEAEVDDYIAPWGSLLTIVTVQPDTVVSWARGY